MIEEIWLVGYAVTVSVSIKKDSQTQFIADWRDMIFLIFLISF